MKLLSCLTEMIEQSGHAIIGLRAKGENNYFFKLFVCLLSNRKIFKE
jgi:hypothetical protein